VLLALVDVEGHEISVASAGHLPPLLISDHRGQFIESDVGPPIGVPGDSRYTSRTIAVPPNATFLAFTDGLVERRGESLDEGLERLRSTALAHEAPLQELVQVLVQKLRQGLSEDDTAIVGVRWKS